MRGSMCRSIFNNWKERTEEEQALLLWFHQHLLDEDLGWDDAIKALGCDQSTVFRLLKGTYQAADWSGPLGKMKSYKRLVEARSTIQQNEFAPTPTSRLIFAGLDYALANNSITMIIGESRQGKTISVDAWVRAIIHGRLVKVVAPPIGGTKMLMRQIAQKVGVNKNQSIIQLSDSLYRCFNRHRILIIDEAHRSCRRIAGRSTRR